MNVLLIISLRNLFRQKRRNILLGIAIAFGTAILVLANAFSHGISDILFNQIVSYVSGHVSVNFTKNGNMYNQVFHDGERMISTVKKTVPEMSSFQEAIGIMGRAIGHGKSDNVIMVGMDIDTKMSKKEEDEYRKNFKVLEGAFENLKDTTYDHPVIMSQEKAKYLNVKYLDDIHVRFTNINGQSQTARLTIVAIFKPANMFMSAPIFLELKDLKNIVGYGPHDISALYLRLNDPKKNARRFADSLFKALKPSIAYIPSRIITNDTVQKPLAIYGIRTDSSSLATLKKNLTIYKSIDSMVVNKNSIILDSSFAATNGFKEGDSIHLHYSGKLADSLIKISYKITAVGTFKNVKGSALYLNDKSFYSTFYENWPQQSTNNNILLEIPKDSLIQAVFTPEWYLMERMKTTQEVQKRYREIAQKYRVGTTVDVQSMYETASMVLNLEYALNLITFIAVMILFFIILIGVVNTLRMTIRERTREIGTVRAIGMQRKDIRNAFLLETGFLALFSSLTGTLLGFIMMWVLSIPQFDSGDNPFGMLLNDGHLHFAPTFGATVFFTLLIVAIAVFTAYFPARKAAKMSASDALRHFE